MSFKQIVQNFFSLPQVKRTPDPFLSNWYTSDPISVGPTSGSATCFAVYNGVPIWNVVKPVSVPPEPSHSFLRKEWKCEYCQTVNAYERLDANGYPQHVDHCSGCGMGKTIIQMAGVQ